MKFLFLCFFLIFYHVSEAKNPPHRGEGPRQKSLREVIAKTSRGEVSIKIPHRKKTFDITERFVNLFVTKNVKKFQEDSIGEWIKSPSNVSFHYLILGKSGPVRIHFLGLGGSIEQFLQNKKFIKAQNKEGRLLVIEVPGQGSNGILYRYEKSRVLDEIPVIPFGDTLNAIPKVIRKILETHNIPQDQIVWGGHSFGGMIVGSLPPAVRHLGIKLNTIQLIASGITNFDNVFVYKPQQAYFLENTREYQRYAIDYLVEFFKKMNMRFVRDTLLTESAAGLTLGAKNVDLRAQMISVEGHLQIMIGSKEEVIFPMLHYETAQKARGYNISTSSFVFEGVDHHFFNALSKGQMNSFFNISKNPEKFSGFYKVKRDGTVVEISEKEALDIHKKISLDIWREMEPKVRGFDRYFLKYPPEWK